MSPGFFFLSSPPQHTGVGVRTWSSFQRVLRSSRRSRLAADSCTSCGPNVDANWFMCVTSSWMGAISSWNSCKVGGGGTDGGGGGGVGADGCGGGEGGGRQVVSMISDSFLCEYRLLHSTTGPLSWMDIIKRTGREKSQHTLPGEKVEVAILRKF